MTSWLTVALFLALGAATGWWVTRRWIIPPALPADWGDWSPEQRRAWMRHSRHKQRCACGMYGLPARDLMILDDSSGENWQHCEHTCQPVREVL